MSFASAGTSIECPSVFSLCCAVDGASTPVDGGGRGGSDGGVELSIALGLYFAVEYGNGRPESAVFTWLFDGCAAVCIGNATRLFRLSLGLVVGTGTPVDTVDIGGGSFHPGSYVAESVKLLLLKMERVWPGWQYTAVKIYQHLSGGV